MKKLVERFARFLLRKCGAPPEKIDLGTVLECRGYLWVVSGMTLEAGRGLHRGTLTIEGWRYRRYDG